MTHEKVWAKSTGAFDTMPSYIMDVTHVSPSVKCGQCDEKR